MTVIDRHFVSNARAMIDGKSGLTRFTLALNYLPLAQLSAGGVVVWSVSDSWVAAVLLSLAWLFLLPPAMCRLAFVLCGRPGGKGLGQESRAYKVWWFTHQWQAVFNRLPWIEEILRLVPGVYSLWINMWGGNASTMVYWSPGCIVIDRPLVVVEAYAVIGGHAGITAHLGGIGADGSYVIDIAAPQVRRGAVVGARSSLGPGAILEAHRVLPPGRILRPFARWDRIARHPLPGEALDRVDG